MEKDMYPQLLFIRTKLPLDLIPDDKFPLNEDDEDALHTLYGDDCLIIPILNPNDEPQLNPEYIDFSERVSVVPDASKGDEKYYTYEMEQGFRTKCESAEDDVWWEEGIPDIYYLSDALNAAGSISQPAFGRSLLIVDFFEEPSDKQRAQIRKALGPCKSVWHGRCLEAFAFVDRRPLQAIYDGLVKIVDDANVYQSVIVRPIQVVQPDTSGLSPMAEWITSTVARRA